MTMNDDEARRRLTALWVGHKGAVEDFARRRGLNSDADDIVQEVFLIAWRKLEEIPAEPRAWLLAVARHVILNRRRADLRRNNLAGRLGAETSVSVVSAEDYGLERVALRQAWAGLNSQERETLSLVVWDKLTGAEAGQVLGITRAAFAVRLLRARRHLARLLAGTDNDHPASADVADTRPPGTIITLTRPDNFSTDQPGETGADETKTRERKAS